jgi:hypothetical protein
MLHDFRVTLNDSGNIYDFRGVFMTPGQSRRVSTTPGDALKISGCASITPEEYLRLQGSIHYSRGVSMYP